MVIDEAALSKVLRIDARAEIISSDFTRIEGVVAIYDEEASSNFVIVSDAGANALYKWEQGNGLFTVGKTIYRNKLDCSPPAVPDCGYLNAHGAAGIVVVPETSPPKLVVSERGARSISMHESTGDERVLLKSTPSGDVFAGPLDITFGFYGKFIYFSDVPLRDESSGNVFAVHAETLLSANDSDVTAVLVNTLLKRPFGVSKNSLDQTRMLISDSSAENRVVRDYKVQSDGNLRDSTIIFDASTLATPGVLAMLDGSPLRLFGLTTDKKGVIYLCSTVGVLILSPTGSLIGLLALDEPAFHISLSVSERYLYFTTASSLLRVAVTDV